MDETIIQARNNLLKCPTFLGPVDMDNMSAEPFFSPPSKNSGMARTRYKSRSTAIVYRLEHHGELCEPKFEILKAWGSLISSHGTGVRTSNFGALLLRRVRRPTRWLACPRSTMTSSMCLAKRKHGCCKLVRSSSVRLKYRRRSYTPLSQSSAFALRDRAGDTA